MDIRNKKTTKAVNEKANLIWNIAEIITWFYNS